MLEDAPVVSVLGGSEPGELVSEVQALLRPGLPYDIPGLNQAPAKLPILRDAGQSRSFTVTIEARFSFLVLSCLALVQAEATLLKNAGVSFTSSTRKQRQATREAGLVLDDLDPRGGGGHA